MRLTDEQRLARAWLRRQVERTGVRYRVLDDAEGWPIVPGRYGRVEYHHPDSLAVFSDSSAQIRRKILVLPGVRRHQVGDTELRVLIPLERLSDACRLIKARRRRSAESARRLRTPAGSL